MASPDYQARAAAAAGALQRWYVPRTGLWKSTGWWNAANALTALIGYARHTGDGVHLPAVATTFGRARRGHPDFVNRFFDDNGWWALAWVAAYDLTGESRVPRRGPGDLRPQPGRLGRRVRRRTVVEHQADLQERDQQRALHHPRRATARADARATGSTCRGRCGPGNG